TGSRRTPPKRMRSIVSWMSSSSGATSSSRAIRSPAATSRGSTSFATSWTAMSRSVMTPTGNFRPSRSSTTTTLPMWASRMIFAASSALVFLVQCTTARVQMSPTRIDLPPTSMAAAAVSSGNAPVRLAPPADLELALFFHMLEFEIALIRVVDGLADGPGERHVGRGHEHAVVLIHDVDDPLQGPLLGRLLTAVENQVQDLDPILVEERTAEEQEAGRHLVPDAVARGTG